MQATPAGTSDAEVDIVNTPTVAKLDPVVARQIEELQTAAKQNAESIHVLADNLQKAMLGAEAVAREARARNAKYKSMLLASFYMSLASVVLCIYLLIR